MPELTPKQTLGALTPVYQDFVIEGNSGVANALESAFFYIEAQEKLTDETGLFSVIADIREKSGLGAKPMLSELADGIAAQLAAAQDEIKRLQEVAYWFARPYEGKTLYELRDELTSGELKILDIARQAQKSVDFPASEAAASAVLAEAKMGKPDIQTGIP